MIFVREMMCYPFVGQINHTAMVPFLSNHLFLNVNGVCHPRRSAILLELYQAM